MRIQGTRILCDSLNIILICSHNYRETEIDTASQRGETEDKNIVVMKPSYVGALSDDTALDIGPNVRQIFTHRDGIWTAGS